MRKDKTGDTAQIQTRSEDTTATPPAFVALEANTFVSKIKVKKIKTPKYVSFRS